MPTSEVWRARVAEWEKRHGYSAESVYLAMRNKPRTLDRRFPGLSDRGREEGATLWHELQHQLGAEEVTRRLAGAERAEMLEDDVGRASD